MLLDAIYELHSWKPAPGESSLVQSFKLNATLQKLLSPVANPASKKDIYSNYHDKVKNRYEKFKDVYAECASNDHKRLANILLGYLEEYETSDRATHSFVIHGDPVFCNVLLTADGRALLLDMRGQLGPSFSLEGDAVYDLAKIYQVRKEN
jgi:ribosomal protein S17E